ncbi:hypothetical protein M422DRAFT_247907, partial [Sphaerobolus stellatus SS14]
TSKVFEENIRAVEKPAPHEPKALTTVLRTLPPAPPARSFNYQARLPIPVANTRPEPTKVPDGTMPMDVDRTCGKASISNIVCRHCGKTGHIARFCDTNFDIRSLTVEEKEGLLYGLMADLDMPENPGAEPSREEEVVSEREDFVKRDDLYYYPTSPVRETVITSRSTTPNFRPEFDSILSMSRMGKTATYQVCVGRDPQLKISVS